MKRKLYILPIVLLVGFVARAQDKGWSLAACLDYAERNNITVKKATVQAEQAAINHAQAQHNRLPSVSANASASFNHGSAINPISNARISRENLSNNFGVTANVPLYQGGKLGIEVARTELLTSQQELYVQEAKNSIRLAVIEAYLQALYQYEGIAVAKNTAASSAEQLAQAQKRFQAGAIARLALAEMETQHASNEYAIVRAENAYASQVLMLKQLLELPPSTDFSISTELQDSYAAPIPSKEAVFAAAVAHLPTMKIYENKKAVAEKDIRLAKAGYLPTLSLQAGLNTGFSSVADYNYRTQLDNNFGQTVGVSLNIPIFSQLKNRSNVKLARLSLDTAELDRQQAEKELYSKVESAWLNATSYQAQEASSRTARDNAKLAYELSKKKYELGSLTNTDLIVSENAYRNAEQTYLQNKYMSALYGELLRFYEGGESREQ